MDAVARLEAAIEKLEALKAESTPGEWRQGFHYDGAWIDQESDHVGGVRRGDGTYFYPVTIQRYDSQEYGGRYVDARLIVTLHRTIDAQLAILRNEVEDMEHESRPPYDDIWRLALAILGES